jgi:spore maturation protein CgeB
MMGQFAVDVAPERTRNDNAGRRALAVCDFWLGGNGYAGMKALRREGWDVMVAPEWEFVPAKWRSFGMRALGRLVRPFAVREFNRELILQARRHRPEFLLVFKGSFVTADSLDRLRTMGVRTYCFYPDNSFRAHGPYIPSALPRYDWVFTAKSFGVEDMRAQLGVSNASVLLHGFDPDLHRPVPQTATDVATYGCDASFIGTWSPKKERLLAALRRSRPALRLRVWGEQWGNARSPELRDAIGGHEVIGEQYVRAIRASKVNIAILSEQRAGSSSGDRITSRTFHIPAAGGFMLHERTEEVSARFREDIDCACFGDANELTEKLDLYLADEARRARVTQRGHDLVWTRDSWDHRVREIIAKHEELIA